MNLFEDIFILWGFELFQTQFIQRISLNGKSLAYCSLQGNYEINMIISPHKDHSAYNCSELNCFYLKGLKLLHFKRFLRQAQPPPFDPLCISEVKTMNVIPDQLVSILAQSYSISILMALEKTRFRLLEEQREIKDHQIFGITVSQIYLKEVYCIQTLLLKLKESQRKRIKVEQVMHESLSSPHSYSKRQINYLLIHFSFKYYMFKNPSILVLLFLFVSCKSIEEDGKRSSASPHKDIEQYDVIVVGAGMAGVSAALQLAKAEKKVLILQANSYIGGRIKTKKTALLGGETINFELGANWIHGSNPENEITQLANEIGNFDLKQTDYSSMTAYDELGVNISQSAGHQYLKYQQIFSSFQDLKNQHVSAEYALKELYPQTLQNKEFMFAVSNNFQFDQAASIEKVNAQYVQGTVWVDGVDQLVMGGYQRMPEYLAEKSGAKVLLNHKVVSVIRSESDGETTVECENGYKASAKSVIITVSLGVLKANTITFSPQLPNWKVEAIRKIGFGNVVKILIIPKKFLNLPQQTQFLGVVSTDISERGSANYYLDYETVADLSALMTFGLGANADKLQVMPEGELKTLIAKRLSVFKASPIESSDFDIVRSYWRTNTNFGGCYSFPGVETDIGQWKNMARPLWDQNWFFGGEHTFYTFRSTVNGAYLSGIAAAKDILKPQKRAANDEL